MNYPDVYNFTTTIVKLLYNSLKLFFCELE